MRLQDVDSMTRAYLECALWLATEGDEGTPLNERFELEDFAPEAIAHAAEVCRAFVREHEGDLEAAEDWLGGRSATEEWSAEEGAGHDLWLTRNGHGAGFWDRGMPDELGERLSDAARGLGSADVYEGDDGRLYIFEG